VLSIAFRDCRVHLFWVVIVLTIVVDFVLMGSSAIHAASVSRIVLVLQYGICFPCGIGLARAQRGGSPGRLPNALIGVTLVIFVIGAALTTTGMRIGKGIGDEEVYRFQARVLATGHIGAEAPPIDKALIPDPNRTFLFYHMFIRDDRWYGKYYPGWPTLLMIATQLRAGAIRNPVLALLLIALTYKIVGEMFSPSVGKLSAVFLAVCPFFLYNSSGYLSHPACAVALAAALLFAIRAWRSGGLGWYAGLFAGLAIALLIRPYTAVCFGIVLGAVSIWYLRTQLARLLQVLTIGVVLLGTAVAGILAYTVAATGSWRISSYTLAHEVMTRATAAAFPEVDSGRNVVVPQSSGTSAGGDLDFRPSWIFSNILSLSRYSVEKTLMYGFPLVFVLAAAAVAYARNRAGISVLAALFLSTVLGHFAVTGASDTYFGERFYYEAYLAVAILAAVGAQALIDRFSLSQETIRTFTLAVLALSVLQTGQFLWSARTYPQPFTAMRQACSGFSNVVAFLQRSDQFEPHDFNENGADWRSAPVFYVADPGVNQRNRVAASLHRDMWIVVRYDERTGRANLVDRSFASALGASIDAGLTRARLVPSDTAALLINQQHLAHFRLTFAPSTHR
jgi:hypothetical protein